MCDDTSTFILVYLACRPVVVFVDAVEKVVGCAALDCANMLDRHALVKIKIVSYWLYLSASFHDVLDT
jgi:hypothetical protein